MVMVGRGQEIEMVGAAWAETWSVVDPVPMAIVGGTAAETLSVVDAAWMAMVGKAMMSGVGV